MNSRAKGSLWAWFDQCFHAPVPAARLGAFRALVCAVALNDVLLYAPGVLADAASVSDGEAARPWTPIYLFQLLAIEPIGLDAAHALLATAIVSLTCGTLGILSRVSCGVGALTFYWWTGLAYSFGKPHHDKVALAFAIAALPLARVGLRVSIDAIVAAARGARAGRAPATDMPMVSGMPLQLTKFSIALGYLGAGGGKLLLGGLDWFNGYTLQGIMLGHDGTWSRAFAASVPFCQLQSIGVVAVQIMFPLVLVWPRLCWFFLPAALGFHLMTWATMDTGPYMRLWLLLFAFVPMEGIPEALRRWLGAGGPRAMVTVLATLGLSVLVAVIANEVMPLWALLAVAFLLAASLVLSLLPRAGVQLLVDPARASHRVAVAIVNGFDWGRRVQTVWQAEAMGQVTARTAAGRESHGLAAWSTLAWRLPALSPLWPFLAFVARVQRTGSSPS